MLILLCWFINQCSTDKQSLEVKSIDLDKKKISDVSALVTTTVRNIKTGEVKNKIPGTNDLATTTALNTKIEEVENKILDHAKYITTPEFHKFTNSIIDLN